MDGVGACIVHKQLLHRLCKPGTAPALNSLEKFKNSQHDVVDVAETRRFRLLGVVEPSCPVDGDVCLLFVQLDRAGHRPARRELAELVEAVKHRTIFPYINCGNMGKKREGQVFDFLVPIIMSDFFKAK